MTQQGFFFLPLRLRQTGDPVQTRTDQKSMLALSEKVRGPPSTR